MTKILSQSERKRHADRIETLVALHRNEMQGRMVPTAKAVRLQRQIIRLRQEIEASDREQVRESRFMQLPHEAVLEIMSLPIIADVLNDLASGVDSSLRSAGISETVFGDATRQMRSLALKVVDVLAKADNGLGDLIEYDETLVRAVTKKVLSYIDQRLPKIAKAYEQ